MQPKHKMLGNTPVRAGRAETVWSARWTWCWCWCLFLAWYPAEATDYYLSQKAGNDTSEGRTPEAPWKSVARVNRTAFRAGDRILLHAGESWPEELRPRSSGGEGLPIIFTSYGPGARPVLDGWDDEVEGKLRSIGKGRVTKTHAANAREVAIDNNEQSHIVYDGLDLRHVLEGVRIYSWASAIRDITIQNCNIQTETSVDGQIASAGIYASTKRGTILELHVSKNHFVPYPVQLDHWGIYFVQGVSRFSIEDNNFGPAGEDAITVWHSAYGEILRNRGGGNGENTIDVKDSHDILIRDNDADLDREYNIVVHSVDSPNSTYNILVGHNRCLRGGQGGKLTAGVALLFAQKSGIEDNTVDSAYGAGILIDDVHPGQQNWASGNRLAGNGTGQKLPAIVLQGDSDADLPRNQVAPASTH